MNAVKRKRFLKRYNFLLKQNKEIISEATKPVAEEKESVSLGLILEEPAEEVLEKPVEEPAEQLTTQFKVESQVHRLKRNKKTLDN